jgi:hypothetical protein
MRSFRAFRQRMITLFNKHSRTLEWTFVAFYFVFSLWLMWELAWLVAF